MDHEALPIEEIDGGEQEPLRCFARQRPRHIMSQHVDVAGLQRGETVLRRQGNELHFGRIIENGGGDGTAIVDIEARPIAIAVGKGEIRQDADWRRR